VNFTKVRTVKDALSCLTNGRCFSSIFVKNIPDPKWPVRRSDATQSRRPIDCAGDVTVTFRSSFSVGRWHGVTCSLQPISWRRLRMIVIAIDFWRKLLGIVGLGGFWPGKRKLPTSER
jgi:hypothetical protein